MKTLYIECNMGAAGDMLMSALLELHPNADEFLNRLNKLGIPNVTVSKTASVKCGITGTHIDVSVNGEHEDEHMHDHHHDHHHHHHHTGMHEIEHIIEHFDIPEKVRTDILAVYHLIAEAESHAHGCEIEQIHFHEVGQMDAVADITGEITSWVLIKSSLRQFMSVAVKCSVHTEYCPFLHRQRHIY